MFCSKCGHQNADGIKFCANCGAPMMEAPSKVDAGKNVQNASNPAATPVNTKQGGAMPFMAGSNNQQASGQPVNNQQLNNQQPNNQQFNRQPFTTPNMNNQPNFGNNQFNRNGAQQFGQPGQPGRPGQPGQPGQFGQPAPQKEKKNVMPFIVVGIIVVLLIVAVVIAGKAFGSASKKTENTEPAEVASVEATIEAKEEATVEATAEVSEDAATESTTEETKKTTSAFDGELSDDLYSFQAVIDGQFYQFPMTITDLESIGWELTDSDAEETLKANSYTYYEFTNSDQGVKLTFYVSNYADSAVPVENCVISGFDYEPGYARNKKELPTIILPGNVDVDDATPDSIKELYGTPSDTYESDSSTSYTYSTDYNHELEIRWYDGSLSSVEYKCLGDVPEGYDPASLGVKGEVPSYITDYKAPTAISDDFFDYTCEIQGDLYQIYCPVQVFFDNGWKLTDNKSTDVPAHSMESYTLSKDNQSLRIYAYNEDDFIQSIENCLVEQVSISSYDETPAITMTFSHGITFGMTRDEVEQILTDAGVNYELKEETSYSYITVDGPEGYSDGYYFSFSEGKLRSMEIEHDY